MTEINSSICIYYPMNSRGRVLFLQFRPLLDQSQGLSVMTFVRFLTISTANQSASFASPCSFWLWCLSRLAKRPVAVARFEIYLPQFPHSFWCICFYCHSVIFQDNRMFLVPKCRFFYYLTGPFNFTGPDIKTFAIFKQMHAWPTLSSHFLQHIFGSKINMHWDI